MTSRHSLITTVVICLAAACSGSDKSSTPTPTAPTPIVQPVPAKLGIVTQPAGAINGIAFTDTVAYRDFVTGFEVVPRVSGERVFLDLSPRRETPTGSRGGGDVWRAPAWQQQGDRPAAWRAAGRPGAAGSLA